MKKIKKSVCKPIKNISRHIGITKSPYKKYCWTEEFEFRRGEKLEVSESNYIYIANEYYDVFQRLLSTLRAKPVRFFLAPIEVYKELNSEIINNYQSEYKCNLEACCFCLDDTGESWGICIPQYITSKKDLYKLGHEIGHIVLMNLPENDLNSGFQRVNYKAEYDADIWGYNALYVLGYLTEEQKMKLTDLSQLEFLVNTKQMSRADYDLITAEENFNSFDRSKETMANYICRLMQDGITDKEILKALSGNIRG